MRHPLERHDLKDLEKASIELQSHIRLRRPRRPFRRFFSIAIGLGLTIIGGYIIVTNIQAGHFMGMPSWFGVSMFVTGMMIVYSEFSD
jgi:hypothetical protein